MPQKNVLLTPATPTYIRHSLRLLSNIYPSEPPFLVLSVRCRLGRLLRPVPGPKYPRLHVQHHKEGPSQQITPLGHRKLADADFRHGGPSNAS